MQRCNMITVSESPESFVDHPCFLVLSIFFLEIFVGLWVDIAQFPQQDCGICDNIKKKKKKKENTSLCSKKSNKITMIQILITLSNVVPNYCIWIIWCVVTPPDKYNAQNEFVKINVLCIGMNTTQKTVIKLTD